MTWRERAECRDLDPETFEQGGPDAAAACRRCPVRRPCLEEAMTPLSREVYPPGYWAGTSEHRRGRLRGRGWRPGDPLPPVKPSSADWQDPAVLAAESFAYAAEHGTRAAAAHFGVYNMRLYRLWDAHKLGRPCGVFHPTRRAS